MLIRIRLLELPPVPEAISLPLVIISMSEGWAIDRQGIKVAIKTIINFFIRSLQSFMRGTGEVLLRSI